MPHSPIPRVCYFLVAALLLALPVRGAVPRDFAVDLKVTPSSSAPHITLSWTLRVAANISAQKIHRRLKGETVWVKLADLTTTSVSFADNTAVQGVEYEYWLERNLTGLSPNVAMGYISAGVNVPFIENRGTLLLVIDDTMQTPLALEIEQLKADLAGDGWQVQTITAPRAGTAIATKALITAAYNADPVNVRAVYLLGHVPVPYAGNIAPDGHGDHIGAWPADGYYGDIDGVWTDTSVNSTAATGTRNDNVPGDGKFDQSSLPSLLELGVGRVDLHTMQRAPSSTVPEATLLRRYLRKAHEFRRKLGAFASIPRRTLIRDGFGHAFTSEPFAVNAWAAAFTSVGHPPEFPIDEAPSNQWFTPTYASGQTYLLGHACGGGSYESASAFGVTAELGRQPSKVVFNSIFGSYHGDWDSNNNLMRAALAGNATGDSYGLVCFWSGRPHYFTHHMGMGETMGYSARISMNAGVTGGGGYLPGGSSFRGVHTGLLGDPALRLHQVAPVRRFAGSSANGQALLQWSASPEPGALGHHIYRSASPLGPFTRLTSSVLPGSTYTDATATAGNTYTYLVRAIKLEFVPGGTYQNLGQAAALTLTINGGAIAAPRNPTDLAISSQTSSIFTRLTWQDRSSDETGFRIERKTNLNGVYAPVGTVTANTTSYIDIGPFAHGTVYWYRVIATGATQDSASSNEVSFEAIAGYFEFAATTQVVNKDAGNAMIRINRFGGGIGAVSINYATANSSAIAGTHFTATSGTLSWADGEQGEKTVTVPITNAPAAQKPRQFKVNLSVPTGGTGIATSSSLAVLIEDPSATLPAEWTHAVVGSISDSSPGVFAEGAIADATIGGAGFTSGATADSGNFTYQTLTGDGSLTAFVPTPAPSQTGARFAIVARAGTATGAIMAAAVTSGDATNFGAKLAYRTTTSGSTTVLPGTNNNHSTPRWLRLTRLGNNFTAESSPDGLVWTELGSITLSLPSTTEWGFFHYSAALSSTTFLGDYQSAAFESISLAGPPAPAAFARTVIHANRIDLSWTMSPTVTGYRIDRRTDGGSFEMLVDLPATTGSYADQTAAADSAYEYRIRALSGFGFGAPSTIIATTPSADGQAPTRPSFANASPGAGTSIILTWLDNATTETGYQVERRALNGSFALVQSLAANTTGWTDPAPLAGVIYEYRIRAMGSLANSTWTPLVTLAAPGTASDYALWLQAQNLPMDASGAGAPGLSTVRDGLSNAMKFALGLPAHVPGDGGRLTEGSIEVAGLDYLTFTYQRPDPAPAGVTYIVEGCTELGTWSTAGIVGIGNVASNGVRTITVRDGTPMNGVSPQRLMRLRVLVP